MCPNCKKNIEYDKESLKCKQCKMDLKLVKNYINFSKNKKTELYNIPKNLLKKLNNDIDINGYDKAVEKFSEQNPQYIKFLSDAKAADGVFHCLKKDNHLCLEIGSNLGNSSEILSKIFHYVYSLEWIEENIEFQQKRFENKSIKNITIFNCDLLKLPFSDNHFDLILCNGLIEVIGNIEKSSNIENLQKQFLLEIKRITKNDGCICIGVENKRNFKKIIESDIPFPQLEKQKRKYYFNEYKKKFEETGLSNKAYWVFPSFYRPYFSGRLDDKTSISWFYKNIRKFLLREKQSKLKNRLFFVFGKIDSLINHFFTKNFVPNIIFCCYKTNQFKSYEDILLEQNKESSFLLVSRSLRLILILFKFNKPKKIISIDRIGKDFPNKIFEHKKTFPHMQVPNSRVWEEKWIDGKEMNPNKIDEISMAINWLMNFQVKSKNGWFTDIEKQKEIFLIRESLKNLKISNNQKYFECIDKYEKYILSNKIPKVSCQGDFWYTNILINKKNNEVNILDWENFKKSESPFFDIVMFFYRLFFVKKRKISNIYDYDKNIDTVIKKIIPNIENHLKFKFDLVLLLQFFILKKIIFTNMKKEEKNWHIQILESLMNRNQ